MEFLVFIIDPFAVHLLSLKISSQRIKWLAHVAISRWDEENNQGWKWLGMPTEVIAGQDELDLGAVIKDVLQNGDNILVHTSLDPAETR